VASPQSDGGAAACGQQGSGIMTIVPTSRPGRIGAWRVQVFLFARRTSGPATLTDAPPTPSVVNDIGPVERAMLVAGREKSSDQ